MSADSIGGIASPTPSQKPVGGPGVPTTAAATVHHGSVLDSPTDGDVHTAAPHTDRTATRPDNSSGASLSSADELTPSDDKSDSSSALSSSLVPVQSGGGANPTPTRQAQDTLALVRGWSMGQMSPATHGSGPKYQRRRLASASSAATLRRSRSPQRPRRDIIRVYVQDLSSYKGLALPPNATFADAKTVVVSKFALTNISEYFDIVVLHPTKDGSTAVRPVKPSEEVVQVLEGIKQQVRSWLQEATQVSRAPFVSLRDTELLKVVLKDTRISFDLFGSEFARTRKLLLAGKCIGDAPAAHLMLNAGVGKVAMAGYLLLQSNTDPCVWRRTWVVVKNLTLFLCLSDVDVRTPRRIHLGDASVRKARITKLMRHQRLQFCFEVEAPRRAFVFRTFSEDSMQQWLTTLRQAVRYANASDMMRMADNVMDDATLVGSSLSSDLMRAACDSIDALMGHPHTLRVLGQFMQAKRCQQMLYFALDAQAFSHACSWVRELLASEASQSSSSASDDDPTGTDPGTDGSAVSVGSEGRNAPSSDPGVGAGGGAGAGVRATGAGAFGGTGTGVAVVRGGGLGVTAAEASTSVRTTKSAPRSRRTVGGVVVTKGSDEDVAIARQRYSAVCRAHLWAVGIHIWDTYQENMDLFCRLCGDSLTPPILAKIDGTIAEVRGELEGRAAVPTELPPAGLFTPVRQVLMAYMKKSILPEFMEAPFYWSLLHSLALKVVSPTRPGKSIHEVHWRRWIPKFDMMGYLHATRMRERQRNNTRAATEAARDRARSRGGLASAGVGQDTTSGSMGGAGSNRRGRKGRSAASLWLFGPGASSDSGDAKPAAGAPRNGTGSGVGHHSSQSSSSKSGASGRRSSGSAPDGVQRQFSEGHIRVPSEFLAARAAPFQRRPRVAPSPPAFKASISNESGDNTPASSEYKYTLEGVATIESLPSPLPLPSQPLKRVLVSAVPHFLDSRVFSDTYGEQQMKRV